jgi:hypothetical protein
MSVGNPKFDLINKDKTLPEIEDIKNDSIK